MAEIWGFSYQELKITMINMLMALTEKVDNRQEQMGKVSRDMETLRNNQKKMLEMKNTVTEIKNVFDGLISILVRDEERISELNIRQYKLPKLKRKMNFVSQTHSCYNVLHQTSFPLIWTLAMTLPLVTRYH